jgi:hypothetical protein
MTIHAPKESHAKGGFQRKREALETGSLTNLHIVSIWIQQRNVIHISELKTQKQRYNMLGETLYVNRDIEIPSNHNKLTRRDIIALEIMKERHTSAGIQSIAEMADELIRANDKLDKGLDE